jgi:hypothetical protein
MKTITVFSAMLLLVILPQEYQVASPQAGKSIAQVALEGSFELDTSADKALLFFTPQGEKAWVKGWNPEPVYPPQTEVVFQTNAVFRVNEDSEHSLWTIVEANFERHVAEYVYVVEGVRLSRVRVDVEPRGANRSRVRVHYVHTATSEKGIQFLASVTEQAFAQKMLSWQRMVSAVIRQPQR